MRIRLALTRAVNATGIFVARRRERGVYEHADPNELAGHAWGAVTVSHLEGSHEGERVRRASDAGS